MHVSCEFHPVGQGIFSTGELNHNGRRFRWAYDCGTVSKQIYLTRPLEAVLDRFGPVRPQLDLAVLSHFDKDHLSGFVRLLTATTVKTLLLPYMPLAERLMLAIESGASDDSDLAQFLINPARFFGNQERFQVETILFVTGRNVPPNEDEPPSSEGDQPNPDGEPDKRLDSEPTSADGNENLPLVAQYAVATNRELNPDEQLELQWHLEEEQTVTKVEFLRPHSGLFVGKKWEFFPYNDIIPSKRITKIFIAEVKKKRKALLSAPTDEALKAVRHLYDSHFGKTGKMRNAISLFMYAGTFLDRAKPSAQSVCVQYFGLSPSGIFRVEHLHLEDSGIIYTGDGYLKTAEQVIRFASAISAERLGRKNFLQVMHHGSRNNSHATIARFLSPLASIYCSDPANRRFKHPHIEVQKQFFNYEPLQVDLEYEVKILFNIFC